MNGAAVPPPGLPAVSTSSPSQTATSAVGPAPTSAGSSSTLSSALASGQVSGITVPSSLPTAPSSSSALSAATSAESGSAGSTSAVTGQQVPATPQTAEQATLLESRRLAAYVVAPMVIEPTFAQVSLPTLPYKSASALSVLLGDPVPGIASDNKMVAAFSSARSGPDGAGMVLADFEFPSPAGATKTAKSMSDGVGYTTSPSKLSGFAAAIVTTTKGSTGLPIAQVFLPVGPVVVYGWLEGPKGASAADQTKALTTAMTMESKLLGSFKPVSGGLNSQPMDHDGLLAHTLPNTGENATVADGIYPAAGALNFDSNPTQTQKLFTQAGVDYVALGRTTVYRAKDAAGAVVVRDGFLAENKQSDPSTQAFDPGPLGSAASCAQGSSLSSYYCLVTHGRYLVEVSETSPSRAISTAQAQLALLDQL